MTTHKTSGKKRSFFRSLFFVVLLLSAPGCGGCRGTLTGTVSYQGETVHGGSVVLVGPDSRPMTAAIKEDGSYKFTDVPVGEARLAVYGQTRNARLVAALKKAFGSGIKIDGGGGGGGLKIVISQGGGIKMGGDGDSKEASVPDSYKDPELSGLRKTIRGGRNTYDIEMK